MSSNPARPLWLGVTLAVAVIVFAEAVGGTVDTALIVSASLALLIGGLLGRRGQGPVLQQSEVGPPRRHTIAEALLANIPDPVILVDRRVVVMEANPAARRLLPGLKLRHPLSFSLRAPDVLDGIEEVLRTGSAVRTEYATRVPTERAFEVQIGALPMSDMPGGGEANVVLFLRDLTEARRLEAMRVDFVANASHELRTPLAALLGFIETLQGPARDDARAREQFLGIMRSQAQRMTGLIDDLLSLSRIELHEHVVPTRMVDLGRIARRMVDMQAPLALKRGVALSVERPDIPLPVLGDRDELLRVIENLVENAVKYGGSGGVVVVSLHRVEGVDECGARIELRVRDEGPGIAAEHIPRLTERFYRVDTASSRQQGGTGLGLAIVKHTLKRHRGKLIIESEPGHGTTVRVSLPEHRPDTKGAMPDEVPVRD
ncbi:MULTISPECIES: ATP-binding protein [Methylobacteriaceae]|uniref:ATP-binding protein n=1 Tax=Methylobacteriaceae TaxID=119045 RepID=UPI00074F8639|nr:MULTISPECIES: ATP-binding protein [Methylobacteriaceae]AMB45816.1 histidine kinase [Methylobacterium sp. AMS5]TFZ57170.1 PAS domain-containing protein [Methylorubrum sp. Q1]